MADANPNPPVGHIVDINDHTWAAARTHRTIEPNPLLEYQAWTCAAKVLLNTIVDLPEAPAYLQALHDLQEVATQHEEAENTIAQRDQTIVEMATAGTGRGGGARQTTVPLPEPFGGDRKSYLGFKNKLQTKFRADALTFRNE